MSRYVVTSRAGEEVVRTDSEDEAERWRVVLGGEVLDRERRSE